MSLSEHKSTPGERLFHVWTKMSEFECSNEQIAELTAEFNQFLSEVKSFENFWAIFSKSSSFDLNENESEVKAELKKAYSVAFESKDYGADRLDKPLESPEAPDDLSHDRVVQPAWWNYISDRVKKMYLDDELDRYMAERDGLSRTVTY